MAELREAHLRYLLAIYELGRAQPDVGTLDIANAFLLKFVGYVHSN